MHDHCFEGLLAMAGLTLRGPADEMHWRRPAATIDLDVRLFLHAADALLHLLLTINHTSPNYFAYEKRFKYCM